MLCLRMIVPEIHGFRRQKNAVFSCFTRFMAFVENQFGMTLKIFQSDGGRESDNSSFRSLCDEKGIHHRFSCQQNGLVERKHRHLSEMGRTLMIASSVPLYFWAEAICTSVFLIKRLPTPTLGWRSPFEALFGRLPDYKALRPFGCACYPHLAPYTAHKLEPRSRQCLFLGYSPNHKGYRCLDPSSGRVFISRHVIFDELSFPFATIQSPGSTNGTSYDDMVFIPVVRTEERVTPLTPPPAAPTMAVSSPLPSTFPAPVDLTHATNATTSAASSIAGDSITIRC